MSGDTHIEGVLQSGVIALSGGHDNAGNNLVTIPTSKLNDLTEWTVKDISAVVLNLARINKYTQKDKDQSNAALQIPPLSCLADLRQASVEAIHLLIDSLEAVEHQQRGTVRAVYFLKPKSKTRSHVLKKLLGVKPSKKRPRIPLFKIVLIKSLQELYSHIDVSQLTLDFCGTLRYSHQAWLHLYQVVVQCIESCQALLSKLPSVKDKVELLQEYETDGQSSNQLQSLLSDLAEKFHIIVEDSTLPNCLTQSKQTLFLLDHPASDSQLLAIHSDLVQGLHVYLRGLFTELDQWRRDLEETWRQTEVKLAGLIQMHKHQERSREIERKIREHYQPLLREHPIVGRTLSQAELYRAHFTTTLYEPAKELLSQATEILMAVQRLQASLQQSPGSGSAGREGNMSIEVSEISHCLTTSIQPFTYQLQHLQQLYVSIHIFHLLFEKALTWYKKVLKFLPDSLLQRCSVESGAQLNGPLGVPAARMESLVFMPAEWLSAVRVFLARHPPPRDEHVDRLDVNTPQQVDRKLRSQARSLALRLRLLQRVLSSSRLPLRLVTAVMSWKSELFKQPQQDKFPSGRGHHAHQQHLVDSPPQDNSRVFVSGNGKDQTKFEHSATGPNPRRVSGAQRDEVAGLLDKFPEKTKAGSFDYEAQQSQGQGSLKSSSLGTGNTTSTDPTGDSFKVHDKILQKRNPNRGMLRAKSVEFNFNSSSTDGSVFDYERAVSGMQQGAIHSDGGLRVPQDRSYARKVRRGERSLRSGLHSSRIPRAALNDEQAFSDPSEMLGHSKHPSRGDTSTSLHTSSFGRDRDVGGREIHTDDGRTDEMMSERSLRRFAQADPSASSMKDTHYRTGHSENPSSLDMDSDERFVRLTFTPKDKLSSGSVFNFNMGSPSTVPGAHTAAHMMSINHPDTETESGIDATDALDPYDKVIKKIREISSSSVSNVEKLQQVCYLLSIDSPNDRNVENKDKFKSNLSHSTMDLRPRELQTFPNQDSIDSNTRSFSQMEKTERPVETVQRMKKNLAKSMEELNSLIGHSENPVEPSSSDKYFSHHSTGLEKGRYKSELKIHPVYNKPNVLIHSKEEVLPSSSHPQSSSFDLSNASSAPLLKNDSQYQWPQNEMTMGVASKKLSFSSNSINALEDSRSHFDLSRPRYEESPQSDHMSLSPLDKYSQPPDFRDNYSQQLRRTNPSRPSSLNVFSNRNFISPSFLRPASSMRDLTSSGQHPLTLELLREIEIDAEYQTLQALEELDILKNLHEDFASNEYPYSKYEDEERDPPEEFRRTQKFGDNPDYSAFQRLEGSREQSFGSDSRQDAKSEHMNEFVVQSCLHAVEAKSNEAGAMNLDDDVRRESFARGDGQSLDSVPKDFRDSGKDVQSRSPQHLGIPEEDIDRLVSEAEQESHSQEEVALSLQKVQRMLEAEESRRNELLRHISDTSADVGDHGELGVGRRMSHTTSTDNGYGSWASKLVSAQSTSSDGAGFEPDAGVDADGLPACYVQENLCVGKNEWVKDSASSSSSEGHVGIIFRRLQSAKEASLDKSAQNASSDKPFQDDEFF